jgi:hypothetical protein
VWVRDGTPSGSPPLRVVPDGCFELDERPRQRLSGVGVPVVVAGNPPHSQRDALEARSGPQALGDEHTSNDHLPNAPSV